MKKKFSDDVIACHLRGMSGYDEQGREIPDPTPLEVPIGWKAPVPLAEEIRHILRLESQRELADKGYETFEEADDFDLPDDKPDPSSPWEEGFDPGKVWTRDLEIKNGFVEEPDFEGARQQLAKAEADYKAAKAAEKKDKAQ